MLPFNKRSARRYVVSIACLAWAALAATFFTGCSREQDIQHQIQDECEVQGTVVVSSQEEQAAADRTVRTLFKALEDGDEQAIIGMFSDYGSKEAEDLEGRVRELIRYYPGADGGYEGVGVSTEEKDNGRYLHALDLILTVKNNNATYKLGICLQMKNEFDPSMEGVHLIEVLTEDKIKNGATWKTKDDRPGVYVLE